MNSKCMHVICLDRCTRQLAGPRNNWKIRMIGRRSAHQVKWLSEIGYRNSDTVRTRGAFGI